MAQQAPMAQQARPPQPGNADFFGSIAPAPAPGAGSNASWESLDPMGMMQSASNAQQRGQRKVAATKAPSDNWDSNW
jgi:hypothetical protein